MKIIIPTSEDHIEIIRTLFKEYAEWMDHELCFKSFEQELSNLPGEYAPPAGALFLAYVDEKPAGCIGLRKIDDETCEMVRLWVRESFRNQKIGIKLIECLISKAKEIGYTKMTLETTQKMTRAISLYQSLGFVNIGANEDGQIIIMEMNL